MDETGLTINRILTQQSVRCHYILDAQGKAVRGKNNDKNEGREDTADQGPKFYNTVNEITKKAELLVRDLDPSNELIFMRIKCKDDEIMVAPDKDFKIITLQKTVNIDKKDGHN